MAALVLDKTGTSSANLIVNEKHDVSSKTKRIFVPNMGAFFGQGLVIRDASTNRILQPVTGYKVLHMVREAVLETNKEVYAVIMVTDTGVLDVVISYQAAGGIYSNVSSEINGLLDEYYDGRTPSDTIGQIVGAPIQALPEHHIQNVADFQQAGAALSMLEGIRKAIMLGDTNAFGAVYQHIDNVFNEATANLDRIQLYFENLYDEAELRFTRREGTIIVTDEDTNPSTYTDGKWQRLPNVFLHGTTRDFEIGNALDVAEGTGLVARKTNFFIRDDNGDDIIRVISANKTSINEGEAVTFTLTTIGLPIGSKLAYTLSGIDANDLSTGSLTGEFTTNASGVATVTVSTKRDFISEGNEVLKCYLTNFPNVYDSVIVNDTSKNSTYRMVLSANTVGTSPLTSVNEGGSFFITLLTTDVDAGHIVHLTYGGSVDAFDYAVAPPSTITIGANGIGYAEVKIKEDYITESTESIIVTVDTGLYGAQASISSSIDIMDTSKSRVYASKWSSSSTGSGAISSVNEGETAYLVINTQNVPNGSVVNLSYSGISPADLVESLPSSITIYNNLVILPVTIKADSVTEVVETLIVNVLENTTVVTTASIAINDTSQTPTYTLRYSTNSSGTDTVTGANEGDTVYAIIETTNIPNGTVLETTYTGLQSNDFLEAPAKLVTINGNLAAVKFIIKSDFSTENTETLVMNVLHTNALKATKSLTVADTSISLSGSITYSTTTNITGAINEVNEDESVVYIIYKTTDVANGTILGTSFEGLIDGDLIATLPTTVTIINNLATLNFKVTKDWTTEGDQNFISKLLLPNGAVVQNTLFIRDSSKTPVINSLYYSTTSSGTEPVTSIGENQKVYLCLETTNIPNGTIMPIVWSGTSTDNDYSVTRPVTVTVNNNMGYAAIDIKPDYINEATETCIATVTLPGVNGNKAATLNILDTHRVQTVALSFNTIPDGSGTTVTDINEGSSVYAVITGTNLVDNEEVTLTWTGSVTDLNSTLPTKLAIIGNKGSVTITVSADRLREDIAETVTLTVTTPSGVSANATLTINDTSKGYAIPTWRTGASTTSTEVPVSGANEGVSVYLHLDTFGIPANETLNIVFINPYLNLDVYPNSNPNDISGTVPTTVITSSNKGYVEFKLTKDYLTEGEETLSLVIYDSKDNRLCQANVKILDASITPTFNAYFATDAGGVNSFTSVDEPTTGVKNIYAVVKTTNMYDGDVVQFTFSGDVDNNDFSGTPISTTVNVIINNNIGYYNLKLLADATDG